MLVCLVLKLYEVLNLMIVKNKTKIFSRPHLSYFNQLKKKKKTIMYTILYQSVISILFTTN